MYKYKLKDGLNIEQLTVPGVGVTDSDGYITSDTKIENPLLEQVVTASVPEDAQPFVATAPQAEQVNVATQATVPQPVPQAAPVQPQTPITFNGVQQ